MQNYLNFFNMKIIYIVNLIFGNWKLHGDQIVNRFKEDHNCKKIKSFIMHSLIKNIIQKKNPSNWFLYLWKCYLWIRYLWLIWPVLDWRGLNYLKMEKNEYN